MNYCIRKADGKDSSLCNEKLTIDVTVGPRTSSKHSCRNQVGMVSRRPVLLGEHNCICFLVKETAVVKGLKQHRSATMQICPGIP